MPQGKTKIKVSQPAAQVKKTIVKKKKAGGSTQKKSEEPQRFQCIMSKYSCESELSDTNHWLS